MMRHADLRVRRTVELGLPTAASKQKSRRGLKNRLELLHKGGKERLERVELAEDAADIRVYVDPRCRSTMHWLHARFCCEEVRPLL